MVPPQCQIAENSVECAQNATQWMTAVVNISAFALSTVKSAVEENLKGAHWSWSLSLNDITQQRIFMDRASTAAVLDPRTELYIGTCAGL